MLRKVRLASAMALVGTLMTAFFGLQGSGAAAETMIPTIVLPDPVPQFVSQPVVQPLAEAGSGPTATADTATSPAGSLDALVAAQATDADLSAEMRCLAGAIYFEARGESLEGQLAVAKVIINRAKSGRFPASYCGVVYQPSQFSFVRGRSMPAVRSESVDWREAVAIAHIAEQGSWDSEVPGALFFHAAHVSPSWRLTRLARVDNHIFYR
jgi:spore germination cell wall hydrolase CwlJ-like protein